YYRLNVVPIELPPLRKRREDIRALAHHFLEKFSSRGEKIFHEFSAEAMERLCVYDWPGNVRELENAIERVVVLHNDSIVKPHHLLPAVREAEETKLRNGKEIAVALSGHGDRILPLELVERYAIEAALDQCDNVGEAAKALKIGQATLYRKIKQYGLRM
ncbi:MAG: sigma-54-dependent Fis family transcriptional regulator, partial [Deltaproteobacteria bacterium]|nr:sigma-54-dependent Fis family transcriptional regulator [Deltaproteobacteria bacterium]